MRSASVQENAGKKFDPTTGEDFLEHSFQRAKRSADFGALVYLFASCSLTAK